MSQMNSTLNKAELFNDWRWQLQNQLRSFEDVQNFAKERYGLETLPASTLQRFSEWEVHESKWRQSFRFALSPYYAHLIRWNEADCPILAQVLPKKEEFHTESHRSQDQWDPSAEESHSPLPGMTHRYPDRVLWYLSHHCAVYCRFCLRKRKVSKAEAPPLSHHWAAILNYIAQNKAIKEVILSGGDPLSLANAKLGPLLAQLREMKHLYSIRIHTRMPVTLPMRIDSELIRIFAKNYPLSIVCHFNHPRELTAEAAKSVRRLKSAGCDVLNQAVLLHNINDSAEVQEALNLGLVKIGVRPYYLHRCDEVLGTQHFRAPLNRGIEILSTLRGRNPGISIPRYIIDLPGGGGKIPLDFDYRSTATKTQQESGAHSFRNWRHRTYTVHED